MEHAGECADGAGICTEGVRREFRVIWEVKRSLLGVSLRAAIGAEDSAGGV